MTTLAYGSAKYSSWNTIYCKENCRLNRAEYCQFIIDYITGERDGFVLNLNGKWGTGKTFLLRMLYTELINKRYPVIYIDAWESDFSNSPLTVVTSELLNQLTALNSNIGNDLHTLKSLFGRALKGTIYGASGYLTKKAFDDASIGIETMKQLLEDHSPEDFLLNLKHNYGDQIEAIQHIREELGALGETLSTNYSAPLPVIVLVDELDRCRPTYAVELLEVIKHFFQTKNFVFVVASDTEQLNHSIKTIYGNNFDSIRYLKRFFDREARLPLPNISDYVNLLNPDLSCYFNDKIIASPSGLSENIPTYLSLIFRSYNLTIRDIDQILSKFYSCLRSIKRTAQSSNSTQIIDIIMLTVALIEQHLSLEDYELRDDINMQNSLIHQSISISKNFSTSKMIDLCIKFSSLHKSKYTDSYDRRLSREDLLIDLSRGDSGQSEIYLDWYLASCNAAAQPNTYAWVWSDYKRVVNLAGNIS